jgi:uncharacterized protein
MLEVPVVAAITDFLAYFLLLAQQMAPYLLLGFVVAGFLHVLIPRKWVHSHLGQASPLSVLKGALLGAPLPLCSCGVLPVAASLKRSGASPPAVLAFLIATPVTGIDSILATYALLGTYLAIVRPVASVLIAILAGFVLLIAFHRKTTKTPPVSIPSKPVAGPGFIERSRRALVYAFTELLGGIAGSVTIGLLLGAGIALLLPADILSRFNDVPTLSYLAMILIGMPLYVCATGSIPIAAALMMKGLSPGAALAFLLAGPATNTVAIAVARELVGKRGTAVYLVTIFAGTLMAAYAVDGMAGMMGVSAMDKGSHHAHAESPGLLSIVSGYLLLALLGWHLLRPLGSRFLARWTGAKENRSSEKRPK